MGDDGLGMVSISDNVRCFRIGFEGVRVPLSVGRSIPNLSSVVATFIGRTGSTAAVCNGPYSHVTSESLSLGELALGVVDLDEDSKRRFRMPGGIQGI